jgi:hypothetical protein
MMCAARSANRLGGCGRAITNTLQLKTRYGIATFHFQCHQVALQSELVSPDQSGSDAVRSVGNAVLYPKNVATSNFAFNYS